MNKPSYKYVTVFTNTCTRERYFEKRYKQCPSRIDSVQDFLKGGVFDDGVKG